jgi:integrase
MGKGNRFKPTKTNHPGVYYIMGTSPATAKPERIYYISYYRDGKRHFEKAGRARIDDMTAARASRIRAAKMEGRELPNRDQREAERAAREAEANRWTVSRLWDAYKAARPDLKGIATDESNFQNYIKPTFGEKEPRELVALDVDRLRLQLLKTKAPGTAKNVLELLRRIVNFGAKKNLVPPLPFRIILPRVNNQKTEDLSPEQMEALLKILREGTYTNEDVETVLLEPDTREMMLMALFTGMRRGELFRLKWEDVDFRRGFIALRAPKGGTDQTIPLSDEAREILESRPRGESPYVFPGRGGKQRVDARKRLNEIKRAARLPGDFRPMHGLRHVFASMLASSGEVDLYTLQKLLTHKSPMMTQRYAHLRDETLKKASNVAGRIIAATEQGAKKAEGANE